MRDVKATIVATINQVCRPNSPDLTDGDKPLLSSELDSLDFASILMALEDEFGLSLQDVNIEQLNTLNKLVAFVQNNAKS